MTLEVMSVFSAIQNNILTFYIFNIFFKNAQDVMFLIDFLCLVWAFS